MGYIVAMTREMEIRGTTRKGCNSEWAIERSDSE